MTTLQQTKNSLKRGVDKTCPCGAVFYCSRWEEKRNRMYCSTKCWQNFRPKGASYNAETRTKKRETALNRGYGKWMRGRKLSEETRKKMSLSRIGNTNGFKKGHLSHAGKKMSDEFRRKVSEGHKGQIAWNRGKKTGKLSEEHRKKQSVSAKKSVLEGRHHLWKGGITPINKAIRGSLEYRLWREAVFKRDSWTCIWCGVRGVTLNADHIKPFAYFPELRFAIDNGRTLCVPCHKTTDTYGWNAHRTASLQAYERFVNEKV